MPSRAAAAKPTAPDQGRQEKNQAKELENLQRVFEWCGAPPALRPEQGHCGLEHKLSYHFSPAHRLDKKGDKKIDASELADHLRFLGCAQQHAPALLGYWFSTAPSAGTSAARRTWRI